MNSRPESNTDRRPIVVVDDDPEIRQMLRGILEPEGYEVQLASCAAEVCRLLSGPPVDVVVLDLRLPDANGFEVLKTIKQAWPKTEVIVLSGEHSLDHMIEAGRLGAFRYEQKPFHILEFLNSLRAASDAARASRLRPEPVPAPKS